MKNSIGVNPLESARNNPINNREIDSIGAGMGFI